MLVMCDFHWDSSLFTTAGGLWFCVPAVPSVFSTKNSITEMTVLYISTRFCRRWFWTDFEINESPTVERVQIVSYLRALKTFSHARSSAWCTRDGLWTSTGLKNRGHHRDNDKLKPIQSRRRTTHSQRGDDWDLQETCEIKSNMESDCGQLVAVLWAVFCITSITLPVSSRLLIRGDS